ncbi:hypothetical protein BT96DRAFT_1006947 [Gymnopus androsaceus JB14]|uniref:Uncharacterized protein n=1 Tax=Gymnopus androsaceus JB14 TaxID=1447944 RepID=A0A6A4GIW5_9AGAR|nr:hypothetical protein BT96DRAFT_1006947 [Gymnopus androsaceus JB14]
MPYAAQCPACTKHLLRTLFKFKGWRKKLSQWCKAQEQEEGLPLPGFKAYLPSFLQSSASGSQEDPGSLPSLSSISDDDDDSIMADDEESDGDMEVVDDDSDSFQSFDYGTSMSGWVRNEIEEMYSNCYEIPHDHLPRVSESYLHHILMTLKNGRPDHFRDALRVSPYTFDQLVLAIEDDVVFKNNSETAQQAPVEEQLVVVLY